MGKHTKYFNELRLSTEIVRPSYRGKIADFSLVFDEKVYPNPTFCVETFHIYAPGSGKGIPGELPTIVKGKETKTESGGQHVHDFDELMLLIGSDPHDNTSLGGEFEFWMGEGEDAQKFICDTPTAMWIPKGVPHNPLLFTKIKDSSKPIIEMDIIVSPKSEAPEDQKTLPLPPAFSFEKVGLPQPGKGKYTKYVNTVTLATDRTFPWLRGRVAVPTIEFDKTVYPAPIWVEIFHVYGAGVGIGVPALEVAPLTPAMKKLGLENVDRTKGGGHAHNYDELFLFVGCDSYDTLNLGGIMETWLGEGDEAEKHIFDKAGSVWVPANVVHNPQYYKKVDKPYLMVVIALTTDYFGSDANMRRTPVPPSFKL